MTTRPMTRRNAVGQVVRGVVAKGKGDPVTIEEVVVPDPGPGEAVVAVAACGRSIAYF